MPNFVEACDLIFDRLEGSNPTGWPIAHENSGFEPGSREGWIYAQALQTSYEQITIGDVGTQLWRSYAEVHLVVYARRGTGDTARVRAQQLVALFEGSPIPEIEFLERTIMKGSPDGQSDVSPGKWYGVPVVITFRHDYTE